MDDVSKRPQAHPPSPLPPAQVTARRRQKRRKKNKKTKETKEERTRRRRRRRRREVDRTFGDTIMSSAEDILQSASPQVDELSPVPPTLLSTRHRKKQADHDALLLKNRIELLKKEEARALKKINKTKTRASEIIRMREENERKHQERVLNTTKAAKAQQKAQREHLEHEALAQRNRQERVEREMQKKIESVQQVRQEKQYLRKDLVEQRRVEIEANKKKSKQIKEEQNKLRRRRDQAAKKKAMATKASYDKRVKEEEDAIKAREREVKKMERQELDLIHQLKKAQKMQREAFVVLEGALNSA